MATLHPVATADRAGKGYWDELWSEASPRAPIDPGARGLNAFVTRRFHELFSETLPRGAQVLEVGCARSAWLPYFALELGAQVTGLDYSERGCAVEREMLRAAGVGGDVVCGDLFEQPAAMGGRFDAVVSLGVAEHFADSAACIRALGHYVAPGGQLVTVIPNMTGLVGVLQRRMNPAVFGIHVALRPEDLLAAHTAAGLEQVTCRHFLSTNFGVVNLNGLEQGSHATRAKGTLRTGLTRSRRLCGRWRSGVYIYR